MTPYHPLFELFYALFHPIFFYSQNDGKMAHIKTGLLRGNISHYEHHNGNKDYMVHKDRRANASSHY